MRSLGDLEGCKQPKGPDYTIIIIQQCSEEKHLYCIFLFHFAALVCFFISAMGVTAGVHRLWSHRSYKAKLPLRIFLAVANSMAFQVNGLIMT